MKVLGKLFNKNKKTKTYSKDSEFKLCIINDDTNVIHQTLGITDERADELARISLQCYEKHDKVTEMLNEIYSHCTHINEVTMVLFVHHKIKEAKEMKGMDRFLKNLFE